MSIETPPRSVAKAAPPASAAATRTPAIRSGRRGRRRLRRSLLRAPTTGVVCLRPGATGAVEQHTAARPLDRLHAHLDPIAQPVPSPARQPGHADAEPIELESLPAQAARRQQPVEHASEADEERALDHADDLAVEWLVLVALVEHAFEQERKADVVAAVLDASRVALGLAAAGGLVRQPLVVRRLLGIRRPNQSQQGVLSLIR